jgi:hypothetical protein
MANKAGAQSPDEHIRTVFLENDRRLSDEGYVKLIGRIIEAIATVQGESGLDRHFQNSIPTFAE